MTMHAMPVMVGVLAILAIAFRFYSGFLARRVAALDDSRVTPAYRFQDGQNFEPTNRWVLFGHHFAAISGAGPLIGPVLAIQFGYLPGLIWIVIGVCLAGAVQDMMVLALSTQRGGRSLASLARTEIGRPAGIAASIAILYIIIIALAGLGVVVVKALGGEEVAMRAGTVLTYPENAWVDARVEQGGPRIYNVPPGSKYRFGEGEGQAMDFSEPFQLAVPAEQALREAPDGEGFVLPENARRLVPGSSWGTFTIAMTIPIALFVGWYMYRLRPGKVVEASLIGAVMVLAVTGLGSLVPRSPLEPYFALSRNWTVFAVAAYGFVAAVLPVWLLLSPRDYLSSFLKVGTIFLLVGGVVVTNPRLEAPAVSTFFADGGGPYFNGPIFPYVFICIMCGAISGFHALVSSGTTPKMIMREGDVRMIGYGSMLMEGLVAVVALIAAAALPSSMYYDINIDLGKRPDFLAANPDFAQFLKAGEFDIHGGHGLEPAPGAAPMSELAEMERDVQESLHGRTGGAVTLAVGMARIFTEAAPGLGALKAFWYHFALMFEALFILTTIDAGTRIARFLVQEILGRIWKPLGDLDWAPASMLATGLVVFAWGYFIATGSVESIWPMFGLANQLLAVIALTVVTTALFNAGRGRYAWVTILPMSFVVATTSTAAYYEISGKFWGMIQAGQVLKGWLNIGLTVMLIACVAVILASAVSRWLAPRPALIDEAAPEPATYEDLGD
ncbi:carbon starvation protein A [Planctomyces sp. SH-PL62]|uniref:carbon starvation CstA family protein n=1 Tax=Planctomyces sp. SH-PL62 TaxID=1636152 RepID=UPI00078E9D68|nr:carbon starvation protein A [Planctomyces sp. SH-PL62]AMV38662.1 Carbon starvation protein A [Planctomyces sp. SH-PL62]